MGNIQENDLVLIAYKGRKYLKKLEKGKGFHGKGGILQFSDVEGCPWGTSFGEYEVFKPTIEDLIMYGVRRETQIIFPKDAFFLCHKLSIAPGNRVLEVGTGSGALTLLLSRMAGPDGQVVSIEREEKHHKNAGKNIEKFKEYDNISLINTDVSEFESEPFDAAFIDVREPWLYMEHFGKLLKGSAVIGLILPTANQVSETLPSLHQGFGDIEVIEILFRTYKTLAARLRPEDRMIGHTGYLLFGRKIVGRPAEIMTEHTDQDDDNNQSDEADSPDL